MTIEIQESFFNDHQAHFSPETIRSYRISLKQFFSFVSKNYEDIKATDIRRWLASMEEKGLKPRTIHLKLSAVKAFYLYCMEENKLQKNPSLTVITPKIDDSLPYYLSKREVALLQELTRNDLWERAIVETLYSTGVRISELLEIKLEDIKWENRQIWIRKVESKYLFANQRGGKLSRVF